jgi:hypothetical protein
MKKFIGGSYQLNTRRAEVQRTVNMVWKKPEGPGGKGNDGYLDSLPGLREFAASPGGTGFILLESGGYLLLESGGRIKLEAA